MLLGTLAPPAEAQIQDDTVPDQPDAPSVTVLSATSAQIEWEAPDDGGSPITDYHMHLAGPRDWGHGAIVSAPDTSRLITVLAPDTEYAVSISAVNDNGEGSYSFATSFLTPASEPPDELVVRVTPTATTVEGGAELDLSSSVTGSDADSVTYRWSSSPGLGTFSDEGSSDPTWTAPPATSEIQYVRLTVTVTANDPASGSDSATVVVAVAASSGSMVPPETEPLDRLEFAVEQMLAQPSFRDPAQTMAEAHPWLRQAWDYANHAGSYADLGHEFDIQTVPGLRAYSTLKCYVLAEGEVLPRCESRRLVIGEGYLADHYITGAYRARLQFTLAHELGHVFTQATRATADGTSGSRPDLKAIAMVYFFVEHNCGSGPFFELIADVLAASVVPSGSAGYWSGCDFGDNVSEEALEVVESMLAGEYPRWFVERYGTEDGGFALNEFWADVLETNGVSPFFRQALVWNLRGAFGSGYCSWDLASDASKGWIVLFNPWSSEDDNAANCFEAEGWWDALTPDQRVAALFGTAASADEDAAAREDYLDMDPDLRRFVNEAAGDVYGDGAFRTIGAWWNSLDCRQRRIAVGDGNTDDDSSPYCAGYPDTGQPSELSASARSQVDAVGDFLAGVDDSAAVASLRALAVDPGVLSPLFNPDTFAYILNAPNPVNTLMVTPTATNNAATIAVNGTSVLNGGGHTVTLNEGSNAIDIAVTAQDRTTIEVYTVTITKTTEPEPEPDPGPGPGPGPGRGLGPGPGPEPDDGDGDADSLAVEIEGADFSAVGAESVFAFVGVSRPHSVRWDVSGPQGFTVTATTEELSLAAPTGGTYTVTVTVTHTNTDVRTLTDTVTLAVFGDLAGNPFIDEIVWLAQEGITTGCDSDPLRYCPGDPVTRAQMASFLARALDLEAPERPSGFVDVDPASVHASHMEALYAAQITTGCDSDPLRYCPSDPVTRAQMASFLARALDLEAPERPSGFVDVDPASVHASDMEALYAAQITTGCDSDPLRYCPGDPVTRAQMAAFLYRSRQLIATVNASI